MNKQSSETMMGEGYFQEDFEWALRERRREVKFRQPYLQWVRNLRHIPQPRITYEEAVKIAYQYCDPDTPFELAVRQRPLIVSSRLTFYQVEIASHARGGHNYWKIDMKDGHIYDVFIDTR